MSPLASPDSFASVSYPTFYRLPFDYTCKVTQRIKIC